MKKILIVTGLLFVSIQMSYSQKFLNALTGGEKVILSVPFEEYCKKDATVDKGRLDIQEQEINFNYKVNDCPRKKTFKKFDYDLGEGVKIFYNVGEYKKDVSLLIGTDPNNLVWGVYDIDEEGLDIDDPKDFKSMTFKYVIAPEGKIEEYDLSVHEKYAKIIEDKYTKLHSVAFEKTDFKDDHGISGKYYMSQPMEYFKFASGKKIKVGHEVYLEYDPKTYKFNVHHGDGIITEGGIEDFYRMGADAKESYTFGLGYHYETRDFFSTHSITRLEKDLFIVDADIHTKNDIPYSLQEGGEKVMLLGKDKAYIKELAQDTAKLRKMIVDAEIVRDYYYKRFNMDKYPLPKIGNTNKSLRADALNAIKARANSYGWKETILNAYVVSTDWVVKVNALGTPTKRLMDCVVIMRNEKTGQCKWEGFTIAQNYQGNNSYGNTYCNGNNQRIYPVKCEEVNKY